jgi:hypothetical protein
MIGERSELLARLMRYHHLVRTMSDKRTRDALRAAISAIETRLAELERAAMPGRRPAEGQHAARTR